MKLGRLGVTLVAALALGASPALAQTIALRGIVHTGDYGVIEDGGVLIHDGKIVGVAPWVELSVPANAHVVATAGAQITPGLIDACSTAGVTTPGSWAEHGSEVVPHLRVLDAIDLASDDFDRLVRRGVTTVFVSAGPGSVIGSQGTLLKTAGPTGRRVLQATGAIKSTIGLESFSRGVRNRRPRGAVDFTTRRPTTRMGAVWVFRDAFHQAKLGKAKGPAGDVLRQVLAGKRTLRMQARTRDEIETAIRLTGELGIGFVLEEGTEAYHLIPLLEKHNVPVIFGPIAERPRGYRAQTGEANDPCLQTPALLAAAGIRFCLTANDRRDEDGLWAQGMLAMRFGLTTGQTVAALTSSPAKILGVTGQVGRLVAGLDADVVVWSGEPFEATTRPLLVLVGGVPALGTLPDPGLPEDKAEYEDEYEGEDGWDDDEEDKSQRF